MPESETVFELGGRRLVARDAMTFAQRLWLMGTARRCGATDLALGMEAGTVTDEQVEAALWRAVDPEFGPRLMAGLLVEEGTTWTIAGAQELVAWLGELSDPVVVESAQVLLLKQIAKFFTGEDAPAAATESVA